MVLNFSSFNLILLLFAHDVILLISKFVKFSASLTVLPLFTNIKSSANAKAFVRVVKLSFNKELYQMIQISWPQQKFVGILCLLIS